MLRALMIVGFAVAALSASASDWRVMDRANPKANTLLVEVDVNSISDRAGRKAGWFQTTLIRPETHLKGVAPFLVMKQYVYADCKLRETAIRELVFEDAIKDAKVVAHVSYTEVEMQFTPVLPDSVAAHQAHALCD